MKHSSDINMLEYQTLINVKEQLEFQREEVVRSKSKLEKCEIQFKNYEKRLKDSVGDVLWRMREICSENQIMKPLHNRFKKILDFAIDTDSFVDEDGEWCVILSYLDSLYGKTIHDYIWDAGIPASWLWKKDWEDDFVSVCIGK